MSRQGIKDIPEICAALGMEKVVITPGSRNAPLIISFTQNEKIHSLSITDERSAGYFALGIARASQKPVGLVCTSGTGALNFAPAIAEAYYQNLPMVVFTADRPAEWIDQADGQTIRQNDVFRNHVKDSFILPVDTAHENDLWYSNRIISRAIHTAIQDPAGPVHINIPLREPLYQPLPDTGKNPKIIEKITLEPVIPEGSLKKLATEWDSLEKKMIIAGFMNPNPELNKILTEFAGRDDTVIISENLSNLYDPRFIYAPERLFASLNEEEKEAFKPDLLITIGNSVVSKRLKQYLRIFQPKAHWQAGTGHLFTDTYKSLTQCIPVQADSFFEDLFRYIEKRSGTSDYSVLFQEKEGSLTGKHGQFMHSVRYSDLMVFEKIMNKIPSDTDVHFSNSTPVRYGQLFKTRADLGYYCNRGTSGIDGCISVAAGAAFVSKRPVTVISGDLAFIYDSNALWNNHLKNNFRIIVVNNSGGNIFRLIETSPEINGIMNFFETPHHVNIRFLAQAFGLKYFSGNESEIIPGAFFEEEGPSILEIKTDAATDAAMFKEYYKNIRS